ncbi:hypothetical protein Xoosp14_186 [Xanthomonas phage Xoo-sp14]|nr:hypothetical protein Xoosp14_186 [Xanthomonas phage Xoo-sp14]
MASQINPSQLRLVRVLDAPAAPIHVPARRTTPRKNFVQRAWEDDPAAVVAGGIVLLGVGIIAGALIHEHFFDEPAPFHYL